MVTAKVLSSMGYHHAGTLCLPGNQCYCTTSGAFNCGALADVDSHGGGGGDHLLRECLHARLLSS